MYKTRIHINLFAVFLYLILSSTALNAQLPYSESFTGQNGKGIIGGSTPTVDEAGVDWNVSNSSNTTGLTATTDWFQVQNEVMEARDVDEEVVWESPSIDITGLSSTINLSVDFAEEGNLEASDYARAYYILDNGAEIQFSTNGSNTDDFTNARAEQILALSGNTSLKIVIRIDNNAGSEYIRFDNVSVVELAPCTTPADQGTSLSLSPNTTEIEGSFTAAGSSPDNYLVVISTASTLSSNPIDGTTYNVGDAIGGGTVVTKLSLTTFFASNLSQGIQYYFYIFSYNTLCTGGPNYNTTSPLLGNTTTTTVPEIIITEIMADPSVSDTDGEYFEIYNNSGATVDINGWIIKDADGQSHTISNGGALNIANGSYLVLGRNADNTANGGVTVDYDYASISLTNTEDEIILEDASGNEVDRVVYDNSFPISAGASMYLTVIPSDNNVGSNWSLSTTSSGIFPDKGSPGNIGEATLPVELADFYYKKQNNNIQLFWETSTELNNSHFEVERSEDGKVFMILGEVSGKGTTLETEFYNFVDNAPKSTNYYRLRQVDFDGRFEYSKTIVVNMENNVTQNIRIFPNPTKSQFNIDFADLIEQDVEMVIYNINGQQVRNEILNITGGTETINISNLQAGIYMVNLITNTGVTTKRMVKQ